MRITFPPIALLLIALVSAGTFAADLATEAKKIEGMLMAPCCGGTTLAMHESGPAHQMKTEIREMLAAGQTRQQILDHYVAEHGEVILAIPPSEGFNLTIYLLPALALILGPFLVWGFLRRRTPAPTVEFDEPALPPIDPKYQARLERELQNL